MHSLRPSVPPPLRPSLPPSPAGRVVHPLILLLRARVQITRPHPLRRQRRERQGRGEGGREGGREGEVRAGVIGEGDAWIDHYLALPAGPEVIAEKGAFGLDREGGANSTEAQAAVKERREGEREGGRDEMAG